MEIKTLGTVATYINGRAFKPSEWETSGKPIIRIQNLTNENAPYNYSTGNFEEKFIVHNGDLLFAWSASLGAHIWHGKEAWLNQHIFRVVPNECINRDYLYYYLLTVVADLYSKTHGSGMVHITKAPFMNTRIPVPSLLEQERIVARIEELFSQLDAGVESLKKIKAQLAVYRQAVLKEAFSFYHDEKTVKLLEIVDDIRIGPFGTMLHKSDYISDGIPVINPQHIKGCKVIPSQSVSISPKKATELSAYTLKKNDIIMGRRGEMGRAAAITEVESGWICGTGSILFRLKPGFDSIFYAKILSSPDVIHYLEEQATGTTMKNLNEDIVRNIPIPFISAEKQKKITMNMDSKVSVSDSIEQTVDAALQQAEAMRQSILKKAFEGEI